MSHSALVDLVLKQQEQIEQLMALVGQLRQRIEELERRGKRQATPFSKGEHTPDPKPPGRKPGEGPFTRRTAPDPSTFSAPPTDVPVTEKSCSGCGGRLLPDGHELLTRTDIPPAPRPVVRAWHIQMCRCSDCGRRVRGRHPQVPDDQMGATAHRLGDRLKATAHWLHYGLGLPVRKLPRIFEELYGLRLTQSAITQDALARSQRTIDTAYEQLRQQIATRTAVFADDTGWSIAGASAWLMGFTTAEETLFQIRRHHGNQEVREVIGDDYQGVLQTDRYRSYDAKELSGVAQQKCMAHIQRNLIDLIEKQSGRARQLPLQLKALFGDAVALWHRRQESTNFREHAAELQRQLEWLLRRRRLSNEANDRMVNELGWHNDRGNLLRFLADAEHVEPTNNAAERALRPAVIARKVSQCSKTDRGADAHAKFTSVVATAIKRGAKSVVNALTGIFTTGEIPVSFAD